MDDKSSKGLRTLYGPSKTKRTRRSYKSPTNTSPTEVIVINSNSNNSENKINVPGKYRSNNKIVTENPLIGIIPQISAAASLTRRRRQLSLADGESSQLVSGRKRKGPNSMSTINSNLEIIKNTSNNMNNDMKTSLPLPDIHSNNDNVYVVNNNSNNSNNGMNAPLPLPYVHSNTIITSIDNKYGITDEQKAKTDIVNFLMTAAKSDFRHDFQNVQLPKLFKDLADSFNMNMNMTIDDYRNTLSIVDTYFIRKNYKNVFHVFKDSINTILPQNTIEYDYIAEDKVLQSVGVSYDNDIRNLIKKGDLTKYVKRDESIKTISDKQYNIRGALVKRGDIYYTIPTILTVLSNTQTTKTFILMIDASYLNITRLKIILHETYGEIDNSIAYKFYIIDSLENEFDSANKINKFQNAKLPEKNIGNIEIFFLKDINMSVDYTNYSKSGFNSNLAINGLLSITRSTDNLIDAIYTLDNNPQQNFLNVNQISPIYKSSKLAIQDFIASSFRFRNTGKALDKMPIHESILTYFILKRAGDWCQTLCLLDRDRTYTIFDENKKPINKTTTINELIHSNHNTELALLTHDKILLAFSLLLGLNVFYSLPIRNSGIELELDNINSVTKPDTDDKTDDKTSDTWLFYFKNIKDITDPDVENALFAKSYKTLYNTTTRRFNNLYNTQYLYVKEVNSDNKIDVETAFLRIEDYIDDRMKLLSAIEIDIYNFKNYFISVCLLIRIIDELRSKPYIKEQLQNTVDINNVKNFEDEDDKVFYNVDNQQYIREFNNTINILQSFNTNLRTINSYKTELDKIVDLNTFNYILPHTFDANLKTLVTIIDKTSKALIVIIGRSTERDTIQKRLTTISGNTDIIEFKNTVIPNIKGGLNTLIYKYKDTDNKRLIIDFYTLFKFDKTITISKTIFNELQIYIEAIVYGPYGRKYRDIKSNTLKELLEIIKQKIIDESEIIVTSEAERKLMITVETYRLLGIYTQYNIRNISSFPLVPTGIVLNDSQGNRYFVIDRYVIYTNKKNIFIDIVNDYIDLKSKIDITNNTEYLLLNTDLKSGRIDMDNVDHGQPRLYFLLFKFIFLILDDLENKLANLDIVTEFDDNSILQLSYIYNLYENAIKVLFNGKDELTFEAEGAIDLSEKIKTYNLGTNIEMIDANIEQIKNIYSTNPPDFTDINQFESMNNDDIKIYIHNIQILCKQFRYSLLEEYYREYYNMSDSHIISTINKLRTKTSETKRRGGKTRKKHKCRNKLSKTKRFRRLYKTINQ